MIYICRDKRSI